MIVGITGFKGSGKSVVAKALRESYGFERSSFAAPMKDFCAAVFGWDMERLYGASKYRDLPDPSWDGLTARHALQTLGSEWGRRMHPDLWVRYAIRQAGSRNVVLEDIRYPNEAKAILEAGGAVLYIHRPAVAPPLWRQVVSGIFRVLRLGAIANRILHDSEAWVPLLAQMPGVFWIDNDGAEWELEWRALFRLKLFLSGEPVANSPRIPNQ